MAPHVRRRTVPTGWAVLALVMGSGPRGEASPEAETPPALGEDPAITRSDDRESPLDDATLALVEALTATSTARAPPEPIWPGGDPWRRPLPAARIEETLERTVDEALEAIGVPWTGLRGRAAGAFVRELDGLRLEPGLVDVGGFDPWLYGGVLLRRGPSAATTSRLWVADGVLFGRRAPSHPGFDAWAATEARTADRGLGVLGSLGGAADGAGARLSFRLDRTEALRARTGTRTVDLDTAVTRVGLSIRGHLLGRAQDALRIDLGYDFDGGAAEARRRVHLLQATARLALDAVEAQATAGLLARGAPDGDGDALQVRGTVRWRSEGAVTSAVEDLEVEESSARAGLRRTRAAAALVEFGALYTRGLGADLERAEVHGRVANRMGPVALDLSARLGEETGFGRSPGLALALDARGRLELVEPLSLFARFVRSSGFLDLRGVEVEEVSLIEGGPRLEGPLGWATVALWGGWQSDAEREPVGLWGVTGEGALALEPVVLTAAIDRGERRLDDARLPPEPTLQARLSARLAVPEWGAFAEVAVRGALERVDARPGTSVGSTPPYAVVDLRAGAKLGAGFSLTLALANTLDVAWAPLGDPGPRPGVDLRVALGFTLPSEGER